MATQSGHEPRAAEAARRAQAEAGCSGPAERRATKRPERATAGDTDRADPIELWGRRVGRGLGLIAVVLLVLNLFTHWFF